MTDQLTKGNPAVRRRILDAAARMFHSHGYLATGMNELMVEADVAKRTFYKHFESKMAVLKAYLEDFDEKLYEKARQRLGQVADPKERIFALFDFRAANQEINDYLGCPYAKINSEIGYDEPEINEIVRKSKIRFKGVIRKMVEGANDKKRLSDEELTDLIFLLMDGALLSAVIFKSSDELRNAKTLLSQFI